MEGSGDENGPKRRDASGVVWAIGTFFKKNSSSSLILTSVYCLYSL